MGRIGLHDPVEQRTAPGQVAGVQRELGGQHQRVDSIGVARDALDEVEEFAPGNGGLSLP